MELNAILLKMRALMNQRGWSIYRLAKESGIPYSSLNSLFQKNNQPTLPTIEKICDGFHISLAEFFADCPPYRAESYAFSDDEIEMIDLYRSLKNSDKRLILSYLRGFCKKPLE